MTFRKTIMTILKICGALVLLAIIATASSMGYNEYLQYQKNQAKLTYHADRQWVWHQKRAGIQINILGDDFVEIPGLSDHILRKVDLAGKYYVVAYKTSDYTLEADIYFITKCKPSTKIETSKKFSKGESIFLYCNRSGNALSHGASWDREDSEFVWGNDLDGFKFRVDFSEWDFTVLDKEITLSKAKPDTRTINLVFEGDDDEQ